MAITLGLGVTYHDTSVETSAKSPVRVIFGYGYTASGVTSITNLINNYGVVSTDTTGVGTARGNLAAAGYGGDKAIFGFGSTTASGFVTTYYNETNLVTNTGVVGTDTTGVGSSRHNLAAAGYGGDKAIFGYGESGSRTSSTNLVSNVGVVAGYQSTIGTAREGLAAASYSS